MLVPTMPNTYLQTTYKDREQVKNLGARWDPDRIAAEFFCHNPQ